MAKESIRYLTYTYKNFIAYATVFLNLLRPQESITTAYVAGARICERLRNPGIDFKESVPPASAAACQKGLSNRPFRRRIDS
jgi:hypothetical protein